MKFQELEEGLSSILYHATSYNNFVSMLKNNEIKLSRSSIDRSLYYMSFSRNRNNEFIQHLNQIQGEEEQFNPRRDPYVVIEFDGRALSNNYKGGSINAFYDPDDDDDEYYGPNPDFMEDRLHSKKPTIPNARRYIKGVSVVMNLDTTQYEKFERSLKTLYRMYPGKVFLYGNTRDYISGRASERDYRNEI